MKTLKVRTFSFNNFHPFDAIYAIVVWGAACLSAAVIKMLPLLSFTFTDFKPARNMVNERQYVV